MSVPREEACGGRACGGALGIMRDERPQRPFSAYKMAWLNTYARTHCKPSTYAEYDSAYRIHLLPHFGDRDIADITRDDVKALVYAMLEKGRARATVRAVLAPFRDMLAHAIEDGHVAANPARASPCRCGCSLAMTRRRPSTPTTFDAGSGIARWSGRSSELFTRTSCVTRSHRS